MEFSQLHFSHKEMIYVILVVMVEDDIALGTELKKMLEYFQYSVIWFQNGKDTLDYSQKADIYLLDIMLPDISRFDLCSHMRQKDSAPIIILTALDNESDIIYGFEKGANDYVIKPFSFQVLNMRIRALLNLYQRKNNQTIVCDELMIQLDNKCVMKNNKEVKLRKIEFEIMKTLLQSAGRIYSRDDLLERLYSFEDIDPSTLTVHISRLRKAIGKSYIETIYGFGYRWAKEINNYEK